MATIKLDYVEFSNWLCEQNPDSYVGKASHMRLCPIATFLWKTRGGDWKVDSTGEAFRHTDEGKIDMHYILDEILRDFIYDIDGLGTKAGGDKFASVTAIQCTRVLSLAIARRLGLEGYA